MPVWVRVIIIVLAVIIGILIALIIIGRKMQKKQQASQADIEAASQIISMLVIDKKKMMKAMDANLPKIVTEQIPKYMRFAKLPLVKAKVGPKVMTLIADVKVFDALPLKTEVKVAVSGIYITEIKYIRGKVEPKPLTKKEQRAKAKAAKKSK